MVLYITSILNLFQCQQTELKYFKTLALKLRDSFIRA